MTQKSKPMTVRATQRGFYGGYAREPGEVFQIGSSADFSQKWMAEVEEDVKPKSASVHHKPHHKK